MNNNYILKQSSSLLGMDIDILKSLIKYKSLNEKGFFEFEYNNIKIETDKDYNFFNFEISIYKFNTDLIEQIVNRSNLNNKLILIDFIKLLNLTYEELIINFNFIRLNIYLTDNFEIIKFYKNEFHYYNPFSVNDIDLQLKCNKNKLIFEINENLKYKSSFVEEIVKKYKLNFETINSLNNLIEILKH